MEWPSGMNSTPMVRHGWPYVDLLESKSCVVHGAVIAQGEQSSCFFGSCYYAERSSAAIFGVGKCLPETDGNLLSWQSRL